MTKARKKVSRKRTDGLVGSGALFGGSKRKNAEQRHASKFLELYGIVHYLLTEQRCPVIFDGRLGYVSCPGVCKEAFKKAIDRRVARNLCAMISRAPSVRVPSLEA